MIVENEMNAAEALYGFAAWLTTRDEKVVASSVHDSSIWADLVDRFIKHNNLSPVRDDVWPDNLKIHPN